MLRPYVVAFLLTYLVVAGRDLGGRRAMAWLGWGWLVAFAAEYASTRMGAPVRALPLHRAHRRPGAVRRQRAPVQPAVLPLPVLRGVEPGPRGGRAAARGRDRADGRPAHDASRRRHRSARRARRALVPRRHLLLPRARRVLRGAAVELRGLGAGGVGHRGRARADALLRTRGPGPGGSPSAPPPGAPPSTTPFSSSISRSPSPSERASLFAVGAGLHLALGAALLVRHRRAREARPSWAGHFGSAGRPVVEGSVER